MEQEIYIIDNSGEIYKKICQILSNEKEYIIKRIYDNEIDKALKNIPAMIIINDFGISEEIVEMCKKIRLNEDNKITPLLVITDNDKNKVINVMKENAYCVFTPIDSQYIYYMIKNTSELLYLNRKISPLTGLPGNVQIQLEIKKALLNEKKFALLYFDLDNFKAYNDVYGFLKGDEIIKFTAKTIIENIQKNNCNDSFIGHIGGDDFIALIRNDNYEKVCRDIISEFDANIEKFFTQEDYKNGYIEVVNRKGDIEQFPLTSISIGVVEVSKERFENSLQIAEAGAEVKHMVKSIMGSAYLIDRRKNVVKD